MSVFGPLAVALLLACLCVCLFSKQISSFARSFEMKKCLQIDYVVSELNN